MSTHFHVTSATDFLVSKNVEFSTLDELLQYIRDTGFEVVLTRPIEDEGGIWGLLIYDGYIE